MYFRIIALFYFNQVGQVYMSPYPDKFRALILDPLEQCTNLLAQAKFNQFKDLNSKEIRRMSGVNREIKIKWPEREFTKKSGVIREIAKKVA